MYPINDKRDPKGGFGLSKFKNFTKKEICEI